MTASKAGHGHRGKAAAAARPVCGCRVTVDTEERRRLVEACAFFRAQRFRAAEPGHIRERDLHKAAADIDAVIKPRPRRGIRR